MTAPAPDTEPGDYQPKHYHVLAQVMSRETNLAIFRRFEDLNYLRLMRLQAEIMEAKVVFEDRCKEDHTENPEFSKSFRALHLSRKSQVKPLYSGDEQLQSRYQGQEVDEPPGESSLWQCSQLEILEHIDRKLSEYSTNSPLCDYAIFTFADFFLDQLLIECTKHLISWLSHVVPRFN